MPFAFLSFFFPSTKGSLKMHIMRVHEKRSGEPRICKICWVTLSSYMELYKHMNTVHFPDRSERRPTSIFREITLILFRNRCDVCGKSFARRDKLTKHMRSHEDGKVRLSCSENGMTLH